MLELSLKSESQSEFILVTACGLIWALLISAGMIWGIWRTITARRASSNATEAGPSFRMLRTLELLGYETALILLTSLHIALWMICLTSGQRDRLSLSTLAVGVTVSVIVWRWLCDARSGPGLWKQCVSLGLCGAQTAGLALLLNTYTVPTADNSDPASVPGEVVAKAEWFAVTDQGNPLGLYERRLPSEQFAEFIDRIRPQMASLARQAIRRNPAAMVANCHGWVFARGEHLVRNEDVQQILNENGYTMQSCPKIGDVVVYRNLSGNVVHTAVVCGLVEDDAALVQSKWGVEGCFVHLASDQPYSQDYTFWRSARPTHCLNIYHRNENGVATPVHTADVIIDD